MVSEGGRWPLSPGYPEFPENEEETTPVSIEELWKKKIIPEFLEDIHSRMDIESEMKSLKAEIATLRKAIETLPSQVRIIETHEVSQDEAEREVGKYLEEKGRAYPSDIASDIGISLKEAVEALNRLTEKGVVKPK